MSFLVLMTYWVFIPFLVFKAARWLFRRIENRLGKGLVIATTAGLAVWFLWIAVGENMWLDHQVRELCAKDGGVKVYETVTLPADKFDKYGIVHIPFKKYSKTEDEYYYESENHYYRESYPTLSRSEFRIIRRKDGKVLGESIFYSRGGGGLPGPWHGSGFTCPNPAQSPGLETSIFNKGDKK